MLFKWLVHELSTDAPKKTASVLRAIGSELLMHKNYVYTCDAFYLKFCYEKGEPSSGNNVQSLHSNCCVASEIS